MQASFSTKVSQNAGPIEQVMHAKLLHKFSDVAHLEIVNDS